MYIVKITGGDYDNFFDQEIFVTANKKTATKYVTRYNSILKKWKKYYKQFEGKQYGMTWIKDEYVETKFYRWNMLRSITKCYWEKIETR